MTENSIRLHQRSIIAATRLWLCTFLIALVLPFASRAQDTGYISGTVGDKSGGAVVGAEVTLTNAAGSLTRTTTSNIDGAYVISGLPGDTAYNLVVTAEILSTENRVKRRRKGPH